MDSPKIVYRKRAYSVLVPVTAARIAAARNRRMPLTFLS
jgi:hypothetical protein